jgi:hypothetical protein
MTPFVAALGQAEQAQRPDRQGADARARAGLARSAAGKGTPEGAVADADPGLAPDVNCEQEMAFPDRALTAAPASGGARRASPPSPAEVEEIRQPQDRDPQDLPWATQLAHAAGAGQPATPAAPHPGPHPAARGEGDAAPARVTARAVLGRVVLSPGQARPSTTPPDTTPAPDAAPHPAARGEGDAAPAVSPARVNALAPATPAPARTAGPPPRASEATPAPRASEATPAPRAFEAAPAIPALAEPAPRARPPRAAIDDGEAPASRTRPVHRRRDEATPAAAAPASEASAPRPIPPIHPGPAHARDLGFAARLADPHAARAAGEPRVREAERGERAAPAVAPSGAAPAVLLAPVVGPPSPSGPAPAEVARTDGPREPRATSAELSGALLPHAAHLKVTSDTLGEVALHLRVRDGVAHVRVEAETAQALDARAPELARALAAEGLKLGSFEAERPERRPEPGAAHGGPDARARADADSGPDGQGRRPHDPSDPDEDPFPFARPRSARRRGLTA